MNNLLNEFLTETTENMEQLDSQIVDLERDPNNESILASVFRLVHTIKGTCGFLGLSRLEAVAHAAENVFGQFRDKKLIVTSESVSLIFESLDRIKEILQGLADTEKEPAGDDSDLIEKLNHLANTGSHLISDKNVTSSNTEQKITDLSLNELTPLPGMKFVIDEFGFQQLVPDDSCQDSHASKDIKDNKSDSPQGHDHVSITNPPLQNQEKVSVTQQNTPSLQTHTDVSVTQHHVSDKIDHEKSAVTSTLRVQVEVLENLMTMVSELVLTRNQLLQTLRGKDETEFCVPLQRLNHITTELQEGVMKVRMQPIGNIWSKLPRIIRDLALELKKKIDLQMIGSETELDRQVLDIIKDPVVHMIRNAADHGIETPDERIAAGKSIVGTIVLNAYHEGGYIHIEISDDGRGLNLDRLKEKIIANHLVTSKELKLMSDQQIQQFIFHPGVSTAEKVTSISGRGVGMDVVRTNINKIGGSIEFKTELGVGSSFFIKIPLTLAIVSALIVGCEEERFAIPQISVLELVRLGSKSDHQIDEIQGVPMLRLRDNLLALISLNELLGLSKKPLTTDELMTKFIVIAQVGGRMLGIIVDRIYDSEEIVVKPVSSILRSISLFSGNTILGDGSVIMILDINDIARHFYASSHQLIGKIQKETVPELEEKEKIALFIFRAGDSVPKAVPLSLVSRLEQIDCSNIEHINGQCVVQYRGAIMPIITINESIAIPESGTNIALVFSEEQRHMGLIIDEIVDIVEQGLDVELGGQSGVLGSSIIRGRVTEIIDVSYYLSRGFPEWFRNQNVVHSTGKQELLLVDDSSFFRNLILPNLLKAGFHVTVALTGIEALKMRDSGKNFDVIVTDIEMPDMDGFELCEAIRQENSLWKDIPVIAISAHSAPEDIARAHEVGFTDYVAKHAHNILINVLHKVLKNKMLAA